ncbi:MAG: nitroreductase [Actinomycetia bacterium]|nr:nitroreductase [Actinomycetes bacterium]
MNVTEAVNARKTIRAFLPDPIDDAMIERLLVGAARAPSGGNVQPWRIYVVNGESMPRLHQRVAAGEPGEPEYPVYPADLWEPHRSSRFQLAEMMYAKLGILREDKAARHAHLASNTSFFGAPAAIFCFIDRRMGSAQWSDLGMFLQTFMLLAQEAGIDTCPQEAWAPWHELVQDFVGAAESEMLFCAVAMGHADWDKPVNSMDSPRLALDQWATWV